MSQIKLTRVEIQGFRKFQAPFILDMTAPSGEPLDYLVLAGPNGCGKTTILEAILLALGRDDRIVRDVDPKERPTSPRLRLESSAILTATILDQRTGGLFQLQRTADSHVARRPLPDGTTAAYNLDFNETILSPLGVDYLSSRRLPALAGAVQDSIRGRQPDDTEANRIWRFKHRVRQQQGRRVPGYVGPTPLDEAWLDSLNRFWRAFRGDDTRLTMTLVDPSNLDSNDWDLFVYLGDQRVCAVDALSSGEQEIIAMAVPFITEPFDGLLLLDEPELHLHPQWQGRVVRALRGLIPGSQLVVATHADDPWDDAMSWERRLLVPESDPRAPKPSEAT